jgi:hypothetical protein
VATKQARNFDNRNGMRLDSAELGALKVSGIRPQTRVNIFHPDGELVFVCDESGGGKKDLGHYVGFVQMAAPGKPFRRNNKVDPLAQNSLHRRIVATSLVRFEVFRYRENRVHALITLHWRNNDNVSAAHWVFFHGKYGEIDKNGHASFLANDGGEDRTIPTWLLDGFRAALVGTRCSDCRHAGHFESVASVVVPEGILAACHIAVPDVKKAAFLTAESAGAKKKAKTTVAA